jgi:hypothetical protein
MFEKYVAMGEYYHSDNNALVKTVCKAYDVKTNESMIVFAYVKEGGFASDMFVMPEKEFVETYKL